MELGSKIYVAGHKGLVGSAIMRKLKDMGYNNAFGSDSSYLDLRNQNLVEKFFKENKPDYVFLAAAKVGGVFANSKNPANFIYDNLMIQSNVINSAYRHGAKKLLFLGSSCVYPKFSEQPIREESLLSGKLEETNEAYSIAKIAGIEMCKMYKKQYGFNAISVMPSNLYGPNDNYNNDTSHVIPSMINKFFDAIKNNKEEVFMFGDGTPMREFLYVDDLADACLFLMNNYNEENHINIGSSEEYSIFDLANKIAKTVGYYGKISWDSSKPNGVQRRVLDNSKINSLGWKSTVKLDSGLEKTIEWYKQNIMNEER